MKQFTPHNHVNEVSHALTKGIADILDDNLIGIYLFGSLTYDDFNPKRSDIDLLVIIKNPVGKNELDLLKKFHLQIEKDYPIWSERIECSYTPLDLFQEILPPKSPRPYYGAGTFYPQAPYGNEWIINNYLLYQHGVALIGPDFKTLVKPIDIKDVQEASVKDLFKEWEPKINDAEWLQNSHYQSYTVLNLCRILCTVLSGTAGSKTVSAAWVKKEYQEWKNLIEKAEEWEYGKEMTLQDETIAFTKFTIETVKNNYNQGMSQQDNDSEIIQQVVKGNISNIKPLLNKGEVNRVYIVEFENKSMVVRLNEAAEIERFKKEQWCISKASELGIPSPQVIDRGVINQTAFMLLDFIDGLNGDEITENESFIWKTLGLYAKKIHSVTTNGFGESFINPEQSSDSWERYVRYNIESLNDKDTLLSTGVLNYSQSKMLQDRFKGLLEKQFKFGLSHGDLALANIIVKDEKVTLIDCGSAESTIVPHFEIIGIFEDSLQEDSPLFKDFLDGYGLSQEEFERMKHDLASLTLLRAIDKLRWAIDRKPELMEEYSTKVKKLVDELL